jgi:hypothetical protein
MDMTEDSDHMVTDGDYYFNWSNRRGLSRHERKESNHCEKGEIINKDCKDWVSVSLLCFKDLLLMRTEAHENLPFVIIDKLSG